MIHNTEPNTLSSDSGDWFSFMMGEFEAKFPCDRCYFSNHMWAKQLHSGEWHLGLSSYAVRLLQDVYFLDWLVEPTISLAKSQQIGSIESKKAESDLFAPCAGELLELNERVLADPSLINADPYSDGWMLALGITSSTEMMSPDQYASHLEQAWEVAQRTIKGQANH